MQVRRAVASDRRAVRDLLDGWGMRPVARLGEVYDPLEDPAFVAVASDGAIVGLATFRPGDDAWELGTLFAVERRGGVGTALVDAVAAAAAVAGANRLWLVTTNDNVDALRFYQRRGFRLVGLHAGAVDRARRDHKPSIPEIGDHGIPLRDELVLERRLES